MQDATYVSRPLQLPRLDPNWKVYRVRTENSLYELELQIQPGHTGRRCVVLTRVEPDADSGDVFEDSSPQLGLKSLFDVSPLDWIGGRLAVGTAETSVVQEVQFISSRVTPVGLARLKRDEPPPAPAPSPPRKSPWDSFPDGHVQMAEAAASVLKQLCHREGLFFAVRANELLERRLRLAFAECRLMLEAMSRRGE